MMKFDKMAASVTRYAGSVWAAGAAFAAIALWTIGGIVWFGFDDSYQIVVNTGTTIITFLMVFLIQNTQNRESKALHLKLDELIRGLPDADNRMMAIEGFTDEEISRMADELKQQRNIVR